MQMDMRDFASLVEKGTIKKLRGDLAQHVALSGLRIQECPKHLLDRIPKGKSQSFTHGGGGKRGPPDREVTVAYVYACWWYWCKN